MGCCRVDDSPPRGEWLGQVWVALGRLGDLAQSTEVLTE